MKARSRSARQRGKRRLDLLFACLFLVLRDAYDSLQPAFALEVEYDNDNSNDSKSAASTWSAVAADYQTNLQGLSTDDNERTLQSCVRTYDALANRLSNAQNRDTVSICAGNTIIVSEELVIASNFVKVQCVRGRSRSCILDKDGASGRIMTVSGQNLIVEGITFRNANADSNKDVDGGALLVSGGGTHRLVDCMFENNRGRNGGAVHIEAGLTHISSSDFERNEADKSGGALSVFSLDTMQDSSGTTNRASQCPDIYLMQSGSCTDFQDVGNVAAPVPAPFRSFPTFYGSPYPAFAPNSFPIFPSSRSNCIGSQAKLQEFLTDINGDVAQLCEGTIRIDTELIVTADDLTLSCLGPKHTCTLLMQAKSRIMQVDGTSFTLIGIAFENGDNPGGNGGALSITGRGTREIEDCLFKNNRAQLGGAIYVTGEGTTSIIHSDFIQNSATRGGAVYAEDVALDSSYGNTGSGNTAQDCNEVKLESGTCESLRNNRQPLASPVFTPSFAPFPFKDCASTYGELSSLLSNAKHGETITVCSGTLQIGANVARMEISKNRVTLRCEDDDSACILNKKGGGSGDNSADGILNVSGNSVTIEGITFRNGVKNRGRGGAVRITGAGDIVIRSCRFEDNSASGSGGALAIQNANANVSLNRCVFLRNQSSANGGAVAILEAETVFMLETVLDKNIAKEIGGGFFFQNIKDVIDISEGTVKRNTAEQGGGGGAILRSKYVFFDGSTFEGNRSENNFGAIRVSNTNIEMINCRILQNFAKVNAGGAGLLGDSSNSAIVSNVLFENNEAQDGRGGGLRVSIPDASVKDSVFCNNRAGTDGGAASLVSVPSSGNMGSGNQAENGCDDIHVTSGNCVLLSAGSGSVCSSEFAIQTSGHVARIVLHDNSNSDTIEGPSARIGTSTTSTGSSLVHLSHLDQEEREQVLQLLSSHLKEAIEEMVSVPVIRVDVRLSNLELAKNGWGGVTPHEHFSTLVSFDGVPHGHDGRPVVKSRNLDTLIMMALTDKKGIEVMQKLAELGGRLGHVIHFDVHPYEAT